jgi:hypothetical protein
MNKMELLHYGRGSNDTEAVRNFIHVPRTVGSGAAGSVMLVPLYARPTSADVAECCLEGLKIFYACFGGLRVASKFSEPCGASNQRQNSQWTLPLSRNLLLSIAPKIFEPIGRRRRVIVFHAAARLATRDRSVRLSTCADGPVGRSASHFSMSSARQPRPFGPSKKSDICGTASP